MCRLDEWDSIGDKYDNTWGILNKFGKSSIIALPIYILHTFTNPSCFLFLSFFFLAQVRPSISQEEVDFFERVLAIPLVWRN